MKSFLKIAVSIILGLLIFGCIGAGLFWYNWNKNAPAGEKTVKISSSETQIGKPVDLTVTVQTPWYRKVEGQVYLINDQDASLTSEVKIEKSGTNLSGYLWTVKAAVIPFKEGELKDLKVSIGLSPDRQKKQKELQVPLPPLKVTAAGYSKESDVALKENIKAADLLKFETAGEQKSLTWVWPAIAGAVVLIAAAVFLASRKENIRILSPWEIARNSLLELKNELTLKDEIFFVKLSDILRQYIERRFALPATEKTSEEFIQQLRSDSILSDKQRIALERFLGTADMVKFAKMNADERQKTDCLAMADSFVSETVPQQMEGAS